MEEVILCTEILLSFNLDLITINIHLLIFFSLFERFILHVNVFALI